MTPKGVPVSVSQNVFLRVPEIQERDPDPHPAVLQHMEFGGTDALAWEKKSFHMECPRWSEQEQWDMGETRNAILPIVTRVNLTMLHSPPEIPNL